MVNGGYFDYALLRQTLREQYKWWMVDSEWWMDKLEVNIEL